ncbi:ABC transporter permease [uncultured Desulfobacter sp.]|uniref:ABC transporter permease n=1 Tax=uncultured Desulfobacter sp. TaxID=240139 RepID=UPI002AA68009|nr:ABC transporter permease [uncultured Desulfobacter sp.]
MKGMARDLAASRELAWRLFLRNISAKYRQTFMGYLWAVFPPLLTSAIWIFLNSQKILNFSETDIPYPLYVLVGTIIWQVFVNAINIPILVVRDSASMIAKINFPREALILAAFFEILFNLAIQLILLAAVFLYFRVSVSIQCIWAFGGLLSVIMAGMMTGILLTPLSILYGDIQQGLPMILQPLFYLTPIVYSPPETGIGAILATINPISPLIRFTRELITTGEFVCSASTLIISVFTGIMLLFGWILYRVAMPHLVERISA